VRHEQSSRPARPTVSRLLHMQQDVDCRPRWMKHHQLKNWSMTITAGPASNLGWNCVGLQMDRSRHAWYMLSSKQQHKTSWH
jgi:hypothetical protein